MERDVLTTDEAAQFLRLSSYAVRDLARKGVIPGKKVGRDWRFVRTDLFKWLKPMPKGREIQFNMGGGKGFMAIVDNRNGGIALAEEYLKLALQALKLAKSNKNINDELLYRKIILDKELDELKQLM